MPSVVVKLYSVFFKLSLRHRLQSRLTSDHPPSPFGVTARPDESIAPPNPTFLDAVATKDIHIDPLTSLSVRIFLPDSSLSAPHPPNLAYLPAPSRRARRLPVMLQFHSGAFVSGSNTSLSNDVFCRRIAKMCDVIVIAVGYRLAPENRYPAAFEDGMQVLNWLAKQANLAECSKSLGSGKRTVNNNH